MKYNMVVLLCQMHLLVFQKALTSLLCEQFLLMRLIPYF
jgi:hypothetical protein